MSLKFKPMQPIEQTHTYKKGLMHMGDHKKPYLDNCSICMCNSCTLKIQNISGLSKLGKIGK